MPSSSVLGLTPQTEDKLRCLLRHVATKTMFYRPLFESIPENMPVQDQLDALPIVGKRVIREHSLEFVSRDIGDTEASQAVILKALSDGSEWENETTIELPGTTRVVLEKTSGSTGAPLKLLKTERERLIAGKSVWKLRRRIDPSIRPVKLFPFEHAPSNFSFPCDLTDYSSENVGACLAEIGRRGYTWLHGHPQALEWWADVVLDNPPMGEGVHLRHIESNGSPLAPRARDKMEQAFHCTVVDNYNCREVWTIAFECVEGHLHLNDECILAEVVDHQGTRIARLGQAGRLLITSLHSYSMPFIRYEIGDRVMLGVSACHHNPGSPQIRFAPNEPSQFIAGTNLCGNEVFSKVTRYIYGSFPLQYSEIRVAQIGIAEFDVWVGGFRGEQSEFAGQFAKISAALLDPNEVRLYMHFVDSDAPVFREHPRSLFVPMTVPAA